MKEITDFDRYADQVLGPILEGFRPHQQLIILVLLQQMELPVGRRWLQRKIDATGYVRDDENDDYSRN